MISDREGSEESVTQSESSQCSVDSLQREDLGIEIPGIDVPDLGMDAPLDLLAHCLSPFMAWHALCIL